MKLGSSQMERYLIEKQVYDTYPIEKKEKSCAMYKCKMNFKRDILRKKLMDEWEGKAKILTSVPPSESEI